MSDKTCNGWSNWETWNCNLWFDDFTDQAIECIKDNPEDKDQAEKALEGIIQATVEEFAPDLDNSFYSDMMNQALREVNYREIADHYIRDNWEENKAVEEEDED